ncbi:GTP cyclohydrolase II-domain-containing protein [Tribonema minus]|uniref:GTP cyclohydrolase II n=1 Tax=Tribonema minus TaxID=303371 RepID=A0A835ZEW2_9STRA|nr:GTP cyclohydrolase II-domain-containing protein [Tribonema minus]
MASVGLQVPQQHHDILRLFGGVLSGAEAVKLSSLFPKSESPYTSADDSEASSQAPRLTRKRKLPLAQSATAAAACGACATTFVSACSLPTDKGAFTLRAYRHIGPKRSHEPVVMVAGEAKGEGVFVRVHDQCQTSEVLGSRRCDCKEQLDAALRHIQEHGGAVIYLQQEGRGIGLANKVAAYALQDGGLDTVDANRHLGFADDERSYECVPYILEDMGVKSVRLMTNNPFKVASLRALGVRVLDSVPVVVPTHEDNERYMRSKVERMGHLIDGL